MIFSKFILRAGLLGLAACALSSPVAAAEPTAIESFTLKNGMQVVLIESHRVNAVTHMIWYRVGAADDFPGRSGLAHYNEHMMFQGTSSTASGEFAKTVASHGGEVNAFTSHDYTAYYVNIARDQLPLVMQLEADRMLHLAPSEYNFKKEREVIIEERRMTIENRPEGLLNEQLQAALWRNHPYHTSIIGWMSEMEALTRDDVLAFHTQFYHPANAVVVVAGDITLPDLKALAEKYYGPLPAGEKYERHWRVEPPQRGPRTVTLAHPNVKEPSWTRIYAAASTGDDDPALVVPTFVLAQILGGGETSRLYQSLVVRQKLVTAVGAGYDGFARGPGEMQIDATPAPGVPFPAIEAAFGKEVGDLCAPDSKNRIRADDLRRAKVLIKADTVYSRDSLESMARTLGLLVIEGLPPDYFNQWDGLIDKVTEADVCRASAAIFNPDQSVTGYLLPKAEAKP